MGPVYKLQIVHNDGKTLATFHGRGPVERDLVAALTAALKDQAPKIAAAIGIRGRWWLRPSKFDAAVQAALDATLEGIASAALQQVLWDVKTEATEKHLG